MTLPEITETTSTLPPAEALTASPAASEADIKAVDAIVKAARRRPATFADLMNKKRRQEDVVINTIDDDGYDVELVLRYQALGAKQFDDLIAKYPPNAKQKLDGMAYNPDTFGPALVAAVCLDPQLSVEQAQALIESQGWSTGEANTLTGEAMRICQVSAGVPFTSPV